MALTFNKVGAFDAYGTTFTHVTSGTWANDATLKGASFPTVNTSYVRLEAVAGNGG